MTRSARFEIVNNPAESQPWWARFRAANGRIVWTTETYKSRQSAVNAVESLCAGFDLLLRTRPDVVDVVEGGDQS